MKKRTRRQIEEGKPVIVALIHWAVSIFALVWVVILSAKLVWWLFGVLVRALSGV